MRPVLSRHGPESNAYPDFHDMLSVSERIGERLVPSWIQAFVNHFAFVELFPFKFEFHIRITGT